MDFPLARNRERERLLLKRFWQTNQVSRDFGCANIAEIETAPAVETARAVITEEYDDLEPIPW